MTRIKIRWHKAKKYSKKIVNTNPEDHSETGTLLEVTSDNFDELVMQSEVPVLVDFWAPWCTHCMPLLPIMEQLAKDYAGRAKITKVNLEEEPELRDRLGIRGIPMVFFFNHGEIHNTLNGAHARSRYASVLDTLVEKVPEEQSQRVMQETEFINCVLGRRDIATLEAILRDRPELANQPIEMEGKEKTPVKLALISAMDHVDALLAAGARLDHVDLAALGRTDELRAAITARPTLIAEPDAGGLTALLSACIHYQAECVAVLLEMDKVDGRYSTESKSYAMGLTAWTGKMEIMLMLLEYGADIEIATASGSLHGVARRNQVDVMKHLLAHGLDPATQNSNGVSIIDFVREGLDEKPELQGMLDLLIAHQATAQ